MARFPIVAAVLALASSAQVLAQCGAGSPEATVTGDGGSYTASYGGGAIYSGSDYREAIQQAVDAVAPGERVAIIASGAIGESTISIGSGVILEGCGTVDVGFRNGRGAFEILNAADVSIPYFSMTGNPYFGFRIYGASNLHFGDIDLNLSGGLGIRFDRDGARNADVSMDTITVTGAGSHAVEVWNIDGLQIGSVIARDVGECGLLVQASTNARIGLVDGDNVATGTGYATLRFANNNGQLPGGGYETNIFVDRVISRGGGRGFFCVSQSGAAEIGELDLGNNGGNAILIENCYNVNVRSGTVSGGGEVRISARDEFPNTRDVSVSLTVNDNSVRESPCGENISWNIAGNAAMNVC